MSEDDRTHVVCSESLGAYALGALPLDERGAVEDHLAECDRCRGDLAGLRLAADALPASAPALRAPPELKHRVMSVVDAEAELLATAGAAADRPPPSSRAPRRRLRDLFPRPLVAAGAAAAALAVGVVGGVAVVGDGSPDGPAGRVVAARITDPAVAERASASVRVSGTTASLVVRGLPDPPPDRVYQVWLKPAGRPPVPAGATFAVRSGAIEIPRSVEGGDTVMVTDEPAGGSPAPTRPPLIVATPV